MFAQLRRLLPENSRQYREETSQRITWGHWFALFNVVVALLIASRYAFNADWPNTLFGKLYFFVSLFGHFSFVVFAFYLLLLFPLSFVIKNSRTFRAISVAGATIGMSLLLVDTEVFKQFYLHLSPLVWDLLINPDESELSRQWQLLFVPMPLILLLEMLYSRWCWNKLRSFSRQKWGRFVALFFVACFCATHLIYAAADMAMYRPVTAQKANYPLSYPMTARTFLEKHGFLDQADFNLSLQEQGRLDTFYLDYPKKPLNSTPPAQKANILLINLSGLAHHQISEEQTPHLQQIKVHSQSLEQHYSGGDNKTAGIVSLFYGLSGRYVDAVLGEQKPSPLIEQLQQAGYRFGLFSHHGFDLPIYRRALLPDFTLPKATNNEQALSQWQRWLATQSQQPFFSYLELSAQTELSALDNQIGDLWQSLQTQRLTANTLVIVTADIANITEPNNFANERIQVPMLLYWQGQASRFTTFTSHVDMLPTVMSEFLGVTNPTQDYAQGINLAAETEPRKWLLSANFRWNVAILPNGEQFRIDRKGEVEHYAANGEKLSPSRLPLALFLQLLKQSNQFVEQ